MAKTPRVLVDSTALEFAVTARLAHEPLTRAIARRTRNPELAERAAWAVTREAGRLRMSPSLLAAVLLVENRQLDSSAVSSQGAIGLMQVMPMHAGSYGCESADLMNVDANICHGARILHLYMVRSRSVTVALQRYNGCVRGANTPRCYRYPVRVLRTAARLRHDILASATPGTSGCGCSGERRAMSGERDVSGGAGAKTFHPGASEGISLARRPIAVADDPSLARDDTPSTAAALPAHPLPTALSLVSLDLEIGQDVGGGALARSRRRR